MLHAEPAAELLRRARGGEATALAQLYRDYADRVYGAVFKLTQSATDAEDVLQDVFVGLPEALRTYMGGCFGAWLCQVAVRTALQRMRRRRRRGEVSLSAWVSRVSRAEYPSEGVTRLALERAIEDLPEMYRAVFLLYSIEGFSHLEVGELLGISPNTSRQRHHRAVRMLRALLS